MVTASLEVRPDRTKGEMAEEDRARADLYGLLAHLFYSPPSVGLLRSIVDADLIDEAASGARLAQAWRALQGVARGAIPADIKEEYDAVFIGVGRAPVFLYGSFYLAGFLMEKPLAQLRDDLAEVGLARKRESSEPEDHISALCDVMRFLITGDADTMPAPLATQRDFFTRHIAPWYERLCAAIRDAEQTAFYKQVAAFAKEFFDLEVQSFEIA